RRASTALPPAMPAPTMTKVLVMTVLSGCDHSASRSSRLLRLTPRAGRPIADGLQVGDELAGNRDVQSEGRRLGHDRDAGGLPEIEYQLHVGARAREHGAPAERADGGAMDVAGHQQAHVREGGDELV